MIDIFSLVLTAFIIYLVVKLSRWINEMIKYVFLPVFSKASLDEMRNRANEYKKEYDKAYKMWTSTHNERANCENSEYPQKIMVIVKDMFEKEIWADMFRLIWFAGIEANHQVKSGLKTISQASEDFDTYSQELLFDRRNKFDKRWQDWIEYKRNKVETTETSKAKKIKK